MNEILKDIKSLQSVLHRFENKEDDVGLEEDDAKELMDALWQSLSICRVLYSQVNKLQEENK